MRLCLSLFPEVTSDILEWILYRMSKSGGRRHLLPYYKWSSSCWWRVRKVSSWASWQKNNFHPSSTWLTWHL